MIIHHNDQLVAVELKYLCGGTQAKVGNETFALKHQGAHDIRRYDVLKDISRMEQFIRHHPGALASVIVLTNDPAYWTGPKKEGTYDAAFSLREGRRVSGSLAWSDATGTGTKKHREAIIELSGSYEMRWVKYSQLDAKFGEFRFLHVDIR